MRWTVVVEWVLLALVLVALLALLVWMAYDPARFITTW